MSESPVPEEFRVRIRAARPEDGTAIANLSSQLGYPAEPLGVERVLAVLLRRSDHAIFLAEDPDGTAIGWLHCFLSRRLFLPTFAELGGMVVDERHRRMGIGSALLARAEKWATGAGGTVLRVRSNSSRAEAHQFYMDLGYIPSKSQKVFDKKLPAPENHSQE